MNTDEKEGREERKEKTRSDKRKMFISRITSGMFKAWPFGSEVVRKMHGKLLTNPKAFKWLQGADF